MKYKVISITPDAIHFNDGATLVHSHDQDCCESHYLDFSNITLDDFKDLEFDLSNDKFFNRIPDYGIELVPLNGHTIKIPGYGYNNGYYSEKIDLTLTLPETGAIIKYDITECQKIES